jgi:hypothetical protein
VRLTLCVLSALPPYDSEDQLLNDDLQNLGPRSEFSGDDEGSYADSYHQNFFDGWVSAIDSFPNSHLTDPPSHSSHSVFSLLLPLQEPLHREQNGKQERCLSAIV